jgi:aspartate aminotransferase-like enzyme
MSNPFIKDYLMTAGPTPLPPRVMAAMAEPVVYHRAPAFDALFARVLERLPRVFGTSNDVLVFTASGTGAMESAVSNLVGPGQPMLACAAGKFGERWIELGEAYGADVVRYEPGWGARLEAAEVERLLGENPSVDVVYATLSETSTGVVHDVRALAEAARAHDAMLVVDAISATGAAELDQDAWGIDVVVTGSQKALMTPPGLSFVSASQRALDAAAARPAGRYYFDWGRAAAEQRKAAPATPFTPAVTLLRALDVALDLIEEEGLDNVLARHDLLARAARAGVRGLGLDLFGDPDERSTVVTAVELPDTIDGARVPKLLRERGITANGGQGHLKGRILRIAHCGYFGAFDVITVLGGLELVLHELGAEIELGAGVAAAQQVFAEAGVPVAAT